MNYSLSDFDYTLPEELIAQNPLERRSASRLMVVNVPGASIRHDRFESIQSILHPGDLLIFNDARVIPARAYFLRDSGSQVEIVFASRRSDELWFVISNRTARLKKGERIRAERDHSVELIIGDRDGEGLLVHPNQPLDESVLGRIGDVPLPPYIRRTPDADDVRRYQTVYAKSPGSAASPTAGLHFTPEILASLPAKDISTVFLTLDVSWGTFSPVRNEDLDAHVMHAERYTLSESNAERINRARAEGRRIVAVGTTSLRVLESTWRDGMNLPGEGWTDIFIRPPMRVESADCLITNFHTPKSTLLMLVASFAGYELIMRAYREAVAEQYRFFSYGDSMLIEGR